MKKYLIAAFLLFANISAFAQDSLMMRKIADEILLRGTCYDNLRVLCKSVGHRLSGSPQAEKAIEWGQKAMERAGADKVWLQAVDVPHWIRGKEKLQLQFGNDKKQIEVPMLSIGNTIGTNGKPLTADVIMV